MDEQSHLARVVEMMKEGRWDPEYYQKPSLHFYLRIPVTAVTFLVEVFRGNLKRLDQLETKDNFHLGGYAAASNPPEILLANRYFSMALVSIGIYLLSLVIFNEKGFIWSFVFIILTSFSFPFIEYCCRLSVDPVAALCVCATVYSLYHYLSKKTESWMILSSIFAGLAFSAKYNFVIAVLIPICAYVLQGQWSPRGLVQIVCVFVLVFVTINIFSFVNYGDLLKHLAVQISHYRTPDSDLNVLSRIYLNMKWLFFDTTGPLALPVLALGLILPGKRVLFISVALTVFVYTIGMSLFKQMFFRNFFPWFPVVNLMIFLSAGKFLNKNVGLLFLLLNYLPTLPSALNSLVNYTKCFESRVLVDEWLFLNQKLKTAVSGQLAFRNRTKKLLHVEEFDEFDFNEENLAMRGAHFIIVNRPDLRSFRFYEPVKSIVGQQITKTAKFGKVTRVDELVFSPAVHIFRLNTANFVKFAMSSETIPKLQLSNCVEDFCRITSLLTHLEAETGAKLLVENIWPKPNQLLVLCGEKHAVAGYLVGKSLLIELQCKNPILYTRDLFNPTKLFIPEDINLGVKLKLLSK